MVQIRSGYVVVKLKVVSVRKSLAPKPSMVLAKGRTVTVGVFAPRIRSGIKRRIDHEAGHGAGAEKVRLQNSLVQKCIRSHPLNLTWAPRANSF